MEGVLQIGGAVPGGVGLLGRSESERGWPEYLVFDLGEG